MAASERCAVLAMEYSARTEDIQRHHQATHLVRRRVTRLHWRWKDKVDGIKTLDLRRQRLHPADFTGGFNDSTRERSRGRLFFSPGGNALATLAIRAKPGTTGQAGHSKYRCAVRDRRPLIGQRIHAPDNDFFIG